MTDNSSESTGEAPEGVLTTFTCSWLGVYGVAVTDSSPDESTVLALAVVDLFRKAAGTNSVKDKLPPLPIRGTKLRTVGDRPVIAVVAERPLSNASNADTNPGAVAERSAGTALLLLLLML